eukprot:853465-Pyramimonas_sp.AAC.1
MPHGSPRDAAQSNAAPTVKPCLLRGRATESINLWFVWQPPALDLSRIALEAQGGSARGWPQLYDH